MSVAAILREFENECKTTRRVLERVPAEHLEWKPHPKSMTLGALALHVASIPGAISGWALKDSLEFGSGGGGKPSAPITVDDILAAHEASAAKTKDALSQLGDEGLKQNWQMTKDGATLMAMPKSALVRSVVLNHTYHHRGQLSVYLRLLDVPVPSIYGPSADEAPAGRG